MTSRCEFDRHPAGDVVRARVIGRVTDEALRQYHVLVTQFLDRGQPRAFILDLSGVERGSDVSIATVREVAAMPPALRDPSRPRVIVAPPGVPFGLARMYQTLSDRTRPLLEVVGTMAAACAMLGITEDGFEPVPE